MTAPRPGQINTDRPADPVGGRWLQGFLTTLIPGLGHLVAGRFRLAAVFGLPVIFCATLLI
ncbi:MAG: hypothetical protein MUC54_07110, partial [Chloroflexi bacterium]|nr:hypothetical protein [Chloroflexota bacterium]